MKPNKPRAEKPAGVPLLEKPLFCCVFAAGLSLLCCLIAYAVCGVFPLGASRRLYADMVMEYAPFLTELYGKLHGGGSLLYSWATGFGGSFWGSLCYYLLSPFNLILMLLPKAAVIPAAELLIPVRQCLAAAAMALYLCRRKNGGAGLPAVWLGASYAFCGWFLAYSFNIIWLDVFLLLPLLALGIERLIEIGRVRLYAAVFTVMLLSSFYLSIFAAEFAVIYYIIYYFTNYRLSDPFGENGKNAFFGSRFWQTGLRFAGAPVLSAAILGVLFVPLVMLAVNGTAENLYADSAAGYFTDLPRQVSSLFSGGAAVNVTNAQYLPVYSGVLTLAGAALFPFLSKIPKKERALTLGALLFFVLCFNLPFLDTLMHGMRTVTGMYFRYSFLFSFFLISAAHRALTAPEKPEKKPVLFAAAVPAVLLALAAFYTFFNKDGETSVVMTPAVFFANLALLAVLFPAAVIGKQTASKAAKLALSAALTLAVAFDLTFAQCVHPRVMPGEDYAELRGMYEAARQMLDDTGDTQPFYRTDLRAINNMYGDYGSVLGVRGLFQSASVTETNYPFWRNLGLDTNMSNYVLNNLQTPAFNSLFGVKYVIETDAYRTQGDTPNTLSDSAAEGYMKIADNGAGVRLYRYANALPPGFAAEKAVLDWSPAENAAPENQNAFFRLAANAGDALKNVPLSAPSYDAAAVTLEKKEDGRYGFSFSGENGGAAAVRFTAAPEAGGQLYVYLNVETEKNTPFTLVVTKPDGSRRIYSYDAHTTMTSVGYAAAGRTFTLELHCNPGAEGTFTLQACLSDPAAVQTACERLRQNGFWQPDEATDTRLSGKITVNGENRVFCTSIPVSDGWRVRVDGETLPKEKQLAVGGALLGFSIEGGTHEITVEYRLPGLGAGIAVSCGGIAAAALWALRPRVMKKKRTEHEAE